MGALFDLALFLGPSAAWMGPLAIGLSAAALVGLVGRWRHRRRNADPAARTALRTAKGLPLGPVSVRGRVAARTSVTAFGGGPPGLLSIASLPTGDEWIELATRRADGLCIELEGGTVRIEGDLLFAPGPTSARRSFGSLSADDRDAIARTGTNLLGETVVDLRSIRAGDEVIATGELVEDLEAPVSSGYRENVRGRKLVGAGRSVVRIRPLPRARPLPRVARSLGAGIALATGFCVVSSMAPERPWRDRAPFRPTSADVAGLFGPMRARTLERIDESIRASARDATSLSFRRAIARADGCESEVEALVDEGAWQDVPALAADCRNVSRSHLLALRADGQIEAAADFAVAHADDLPESAVAIALLDAGRFAEAAARVEEIGTSLRQSGEDARARRYDDGESFEEADLEDDSERGALLVRRADELVRLGRALRAIASGTAPAADEHSADDPLWLAATGHAMELSTQRLVGTRAPLLELIVRGPALDDAFLRFVVRHSDELRTWSGDEHLARAALQERLGMRALIEGDLHVARQLFERLQDVTPDDARADLLVLRLLHDGIEDADRAISLARLPSASAGDLRALARFLEGDQEALPARDRERHVACESSACRQRPLIRSFETAGGTGEVVAANIAREYGNLPSAVLVVARTTSGRPALAEHLRLRPRALTSESSLADLAHAAWLDHAFACALGDEDWAVRADERLGRLEAALDADHAIVAQLATERLLAAW